MTTKIICADVRAGLAQLADESVHCVVTSPPYLGLRDYKTEPQVWGGEPGCEHEWGDELVRQKGGAGQNKGLINADAYREARDTEAQSVRQGAFCRRCGCWRGHLGLEPTVAMFIEHLVEIFRDVRRVLRRDGCCFLNIGDSYAGGGRGGNPADSPFQKQATNSGSLVPPTPIRDANIKPKDLLLVPARLAIALQDGWYVRSWIVWDKPAPMPESVTDRPTCAHEEILLLTRSARYFWDAEAVKEKADGDTHSRGTKRTPPIEAAGIGHKDWCAYMTRDEEIAVSGKRNQRNVWRLPPSPYPDAHFATFPPELPRRAILAGTSAKGVCPKCGTPWVRVVDAETRPNTDRGVAAVKGGRPHRNPGGGVGNDKRSYSYNGWRAGCKCEAGEPVPATVLDPFLGSGTTALVAQELGRDCIGIELSEEYAAMARARLKAALAPVEHDKPLRDAHPGPLFEALP